MRAKPMPSVSRKCVVCKKPFTATHSEVARGFARSCSYECMGKARQRRVTKACVQCGGKYEVRHFKRTTAKYCSRTCKHDALKKVLKQQRNHHRLLCLNHYGPACKCCGETEYEFLTIDHIRNDGAAHRREVGEGAVYRWLVKNNYPPGFQVLCMNCNWAKGRYGECPHNRVRLLSLVI